MKTTILAYKFFKKYLFANFLIIVEIVLSLFIATILINRTTYLYRNYNAFKAMPISNSIYFMGHPGTQYVKDGIASFQEQIKSFSSVKGISSISFFNTETGDNVLVYDALLINTIDMKVDGKWLSKANSMNDIVVFNPKEDILNKSIDLEIRLVKQYRVKGELENSKVVRGEFNVIGIAKELNTALLYSNAKTNAIMNIENLTLGTAFYEDSTIYFINSDNPIFGGDEISIDNFFIYLNEDADQDEVNKITELLDDYGTWSYGSDMLALTKSQADEKWTYDIASFLSIAVVVATSLVCITFLNIKKFTRFISVYYLNGCTFIKGMCIYLLYLFNLFIGSGVLFYLLFYRLNSNLNKNYSPTIYIETYKLHLGVQIPSFLLIFCFIMIGSFIPFYMISRKSKISIFKNN